MAAYRVDIKVNGEWASNEVRFATRAEAECCGRDLFTKMVIDRWEVIPESDRVPSHRWDRSTRQVVRLDTPANSGNGH